MKFFLRREGYEGGFQLAPMVDIVFQLLIFFMCTSSFIIAESQLSINLPVATSLQQTEKVPEEVIINVLVDGTVMVGGREYDSPESKTLSELKSMLMKLSSSFENQPVIIRGNWSVPHERIIDVLNACAAARIKSVSFLVPEEVINKMKARSKIR